MPVSGTHQASLKGLFCCIEYRLRSCNILLRIHNLSSYRRFFVRTCVPELDLKFLHD